MLFRSDSPEEIIETARETELFEINDEICQEVKAIACKSSELDGIVSRFSSKRSVDRIAKVDLAILRVAIYESLYDDMVPINAAISEAVAIAEKFASPRDVAFINGILGSFSRSGEAKNV